MIPDKVMDRTRPDPGGWQPGYRDTFLVAYESAYITGVSWPVNGGDM